MTVDAPLFSIEPELVRLLKRTEYDQLVALDVFGDERVELLQGVLIKTSPHHAPHASTIQKLMKLLIARIRDRFELRIQSPLAASDYSEPEPDAAVVALGDYETAHPSTALLVVEVADSTLRRDRGKAAIYAAASVREYWIVNLSARTVEVYTSPDGERYAEARTVRAGEMLRSEAIADLTIAVDDILPKA